MSAVSKAAEENFKHGAATYKRRQKERGQKTERSELGVNLARRDMGHNKNFKWTSEELKELWYLRYEKKPKSTYDQLAKRFKKSDTWNIVNALCELQNRKVAEAEDMFKPIEVKYTSNSEIRGYTNGRHMHERTRDAVRLRGEGYSYAEIGDMLGMSDETARATVGRVKKRSPNVYADLMAEGRRRAKK